MCFTPTYTYMYEQEKHTIIFGRLDPSLEYYGM